MALPVNRHTLCLAKPNNEVTGANTSKTTSSAAKAAMLALDTLQQASMDGEAGPGSPLKVMEKGSEFTK